MKQHLVKEIPIYMFNIKVLNINETGLYHQARNDCTTKYDCIMVVLLVYSFRLYKLL